MKRSGIAIVALVLGLVACSSLNDLRDSSQLEAQFGTAEDEIGFDVATVSTGRIYVLFQESQKVYNEESGYPTTYEKLFLRRLDNNGTTTWTREISSTARTCYDTCEGDLHTKQAVTADAQGYVHVLSGIKFGDGDPAGWGVSDTVSIYKYNASGQQVSEMGFSTYDFGTFNFTVDGSGNYYLAFNDYAWDPNSNESQQVDVVAKYSPNGNIAWQRTSTVGEPTDIVVTTSGSVYVAGTKGLARYDTSGNLKWTKAIGPLENVVVSGSNIYTRYRKDIRKFDANGKQLWLKAQTGLNTLIGQDLSGDASGNVYLSGKYAAGAGNYSPFVRKLNSSGSVLWTKTYGTTAYDDARGIATITGSEIYVTGETQGSLAHTNIGGRDGYLRTLDSSGNPVWTR